MDCSPPGPSVHGFPRQEYWLGCPFLLQGIFLTQGSNPHLLCLLHWQESFVATEPPGKPTLEKVWSKFSRTVSNCLCRQGTRKEFRWKTFAVWHEALAGFLWADAKDHKMPGGPTHKLEPEISLDKGRKQHAQISAPGKFPVSPPLTPFLQYARGWEEIDPSSLRVVVIWDSMKTSQKWIFKGDIQYHLWCVISHKENNEPWSLPSRIQRVKE